MLNTKMNSTSVLTILLLGSWLLFVVFIISDSDKWEPKPPERAPCPSPEHPSSVFSAPAALSSNKRSSSSSQIEMPDNIKRVVIEVGSNEAGDFRAYAEKDPDLFYIAVEPLTGERTMKTTCSGSVKSRCIVVTAAISTQPGWQTLRIGASSECSSLTGGGQLCGESSSSIVIPTLTADDVIDMIPRDLPVYILALDCQGHDFQAAASLRRHRGRVANLILECHDLVPGSPLNLYRHPSVRSCGQAVSCVTQEWGWTKGVCAFNNGKNPGRELNCHFHNPSHIMTSTAAVHPSLWAHKEWITKIENPAQCPIKDWVA